MDWVAGRRYAGAMFLWLLLLFTVVPVVEIALLVRIGRSIDVGPTIGLVILTGVVGAGLAKHQGLRTMQRIQADLSAGRMPAVELVNGIMILAAGLLLVTPGVLTDALGFALLIPPIRNLLRGSLTRYFKKRMVIVAPGGESPPRTGSDEFIDVEARVITPEEQNDAPRRAD